MDRTTVINQALILLGVELLDSIDSNNTNAKRAKAIYDQTRQALLREFPHTSCIKTVALGAPLLNTNNYNIPDDCLRILHVHTGNESSDMDRDYVLKGRVLTTSISNPNLTYVFDNKNEGTYGVGLIEALVYLLAFKLSKSILGSQETNFYKLYQETIEKEKSVDSLQIPSQVFFDDDQFSFKYSNW